MPFNESLARRVRDTLSGRSDPVEKRMFGGVAWLVGGHMCVGVWQDHLIARVGVDAPAEWGVEPGVRPFDVTGAPMRGWWMVDAADLADDDDGVDRWVGRCLAFVRCLPAKGEAPVSKPRAAREPAAGKKAARRRPPAGK